MLPDFKCWSISHVDVIYIFDISHVTPTFSISGKQLKNAENFISLGSNLSFSGDLTNEIQRCFNLASSAVGRPSKRVFGDQNIMIHTNIAVYNAVVISTMLYGCETWVPYSGHIRLLESSHQTSPVNSWISLVAQNDSFLN